MSSSRIPGPIGLGANQPVIDTGTLALAASPIPSPVGVGANKPAAPAAAALDADTRMLAAVSYGEGSTANVFEEMAAIANVLVRQSKARGFAAVSTFIKSNKTFAFAAHDGNPRYEQLMKATEKQIETNPGMASAVRAARNALSSTGTDYSNGAFFWDGLDIKTEYASHPKVADGIQFGDPAHNIYGIQASTKPGEEFWRDAKGQKTSRSRGKWTHKYDSTAAYGGTIFWKLNADFRKATGNKEHL